MKINPFIILLDGSNSYFKLKDLKLHSLLMFDFTAFVKLLIRSNKLIKIDYYIGKVRTDGTEKTQVKDIILMAQLLFKNFSSIMLCKSFNITL